MLSFQVYKILHVVSLLGVFMCLGALVVHRMNGGDRAFPARKWVMVSFAVFMMLALTGGFGGLARLGTGMQPWVYAKLALWLLVARPAAAQNYGHQGLCLGDLFYWNAEFVRISRFSRFFSSEAADTTFKNHGFDL